LQKFGVTPLKHVEPLPDAAPQRSWSSPQVQRLVAHV
jgi:hypothetical protein